MILQIFLHMCNDREIPLEYQRHAVHDDACRVKVILKISDMRVWFPCPFTKV